MSVGECCNREVIVISEIKTVSEAAKLMRECHVGDLIVVQDREPSQKPVGILTDRDIAIEIVAAGVDPEVVTVGDAMSYRLATIDEGAEITVAVELMRDRKVRRLPVVDKQGMLVGILTSDDVIDLLAEQLVGLSRLFTLQRWDEQEARS
ncbi:MAG: CBS domain-containing protein [Pseudomonadales bacterium]